MYEKFKKKNTNKDTDGKIKMMKNKCMRYFISILTLNQNKMKCFILTE